MVASNPPKGRLPLVANNGAITDKIVPHVLFMLLSFHLEILADKKGYTLPSKAAMEGCSSGSKSASVKERR
jgi:hypothetical protein